jgi:uncharacterized small protein (DUF1192 family)
MPLDTDDLAPPPKPVRLDLENMSVEALTGRIADLEVEIATIRALIEKKQKSRSAADAFFKR